MNAEVPPYMHPVFRFLRGDGDLRLASGGGAFNLAGALLDLPKDAFPLIVSGSVPLETIRCVTLLSIDPIELRREDLLRAAADLIHSGNAVMLGSRHKDVETIIKKWRTMD